MANLDLSVDVLYSKVDGGRFAAFGTADNESDILSAMFRAQRNFWP